jgi:hypothetical protein
LATSSASWPSSIQFVVARLLEQGNALASRIARLLDEGYTATQSAGTSAK